MKLRSKYEHKVACFGGTFDVPLHIGHEALIREAFRRAKFCYIGLASDFYVARRGKRSVSSYRQRETNLVRLLASLKIGKKRYSITKLENFFGPEVLDPAKEVEAIIVSKDTIPGARGINIIREDYGMQPMEIIEVAMVLANDKKPISSTRIRAGEITADGSKVERKKKR